MLLGDCLALVLMGFYAGVGIWESGTLRHILGMLLPSIAVWIICSLIFGLYKDLPKTFGAIHFKQTGSLIERLTAVQKPRKLIFVWAVTCLFQCFWQSWYWRGILHSQSYFYRFSIGTLLWYVTSYAVIFILWRCIWMFFIVLIALARSYKAIRIVCAAAGVFLLAYTAAIAAISLHYQQKKYTVETVPANAPRTALVFGAGIYFNGQPSAVLTDRVNTAIELYQKGLIDEMIMSGDNSDSSRNEVDHMVRMAEEAGIPKEAIIRDDHGIHTAESCYNTKNIIGKDEVIFISQDFHTTRLLMTGEKYGLSGIAVKADRRIYNISSWMTWYILDWLRLPIYWLHY